MIKYLYFNILNNKIQTSFHIVAFSKMVNVYVKIYENRRNNISGGPGPLGPPGSIPVRRL